MPHLPPWQYEIAADVATLVLVIVGFAVLVVLVRRRASKVDVAALTRDMHARLDVTNAKLGDLARGVELAPPRWTPAPRPALGTFHKPTTAMPVGKLRAGLEEVERQIADSDAHPPDET